MLELIQKSDVADLDTVRHFYRALAGTEFCAWTDAYPGEPELQSDFSRDSLFCIRDDVSGEIAGLVSIDDDPEVESTTKIPAGPWRRSIRTEASHVSFWQARWRNLEDAAARVPICWWRRTM